MRIYYRGYVIDDDRWAADCSVYGARPERQFITARDDPQSAMKWIDGDVARRADRSQGWQRHLPLPV